MFRIKNGGCQPQIQYCRYSQSYVWETVKKDKTVPPVPKIPSPTKAPGSGSKKRKTVEILDLTLDDSDPMEVMKKLSIMTEAVRIFVLYYLFLVNTDSILPNIVF